MQGAARGPPFSPMQTCTILEPSRHRDFQTGTVPSFKLSMSARQTISLFSIIQQRHIFSSFFGSNGYSHNSSFGVQIA